MPFFYSSGEEIAKGDRVLLHGEPGEIELVADPAESPDDLLVKKQGGGIMVLELKVFGRLFISEPQTDEHLTLYLDRRSGDLAAARKTDFQTFGQRHKRRITGISVPHHFTAPTRDIVHPDLLKEAEEKYGADRWPDSIACRAIYRIIDPPSIDRLFSEPRLVTGTRGRYLADLSGVTNLFEQIGNFDIEELDLYQSPRYVALASQPRQAIRRQAGWASTVPPNIQGILYEKVRSLFAAEAASGAVYEYLRPDRKVTIDQTPLLLMLLELWEAQEGCCDYCRIVLETAGLAQVSIDRIDNNNREYGRHNIHLTCWECNRGKGTATHEEMVELWEKRKRAWSHQRLDRQPTPPRLESEF